MLVPCLQCKSPVFVSGSAVAAGDVRSTCGNCGSALIVERGGVVRLAEPPPGPAAAPQLIVPPAFEPPSHATTMREYASADDVPPDNGQLYVARQAPTSPRDFNALLGADVRAYVEDGEQPAPKPTFSGPAVFGSDDDQPTQPNPQIMPEFAPPEVMQTSGPELTQPEETFVPAEAMYTPISVPFEVPTQVAPALEAEEPEEISADLMEVEDTVVEEEPLQPVKWPESTEPVDDEALEPVKWPGSEATGEEPSAEFGSPSADFGSPSVEFGSPVGEEPIADDRLPVADEPIADEPIAEEQPLSVADFGTPISDEPTAVTEQPAQENPPALASYESMYAPPERPSALMFSNTNVSGLAGPAREAEQTRLAPAVRQPDYQPAPAPEAENPVLLTDEAPPAETLSLTEMPEWAGDSLEEAQAYVPPFAAPVREDEIDTALSAPAEAAPRPAPTPESYFDASDPLAAAEADMYAGHQVVQPTEMVGDAFTAMVPPVGTHVPHDSVTVNMSMDPATASAIADAEDLAVLRASRRRGMIWAVGACVLFAFGCVSFAASRGYLDPLIAHVSGMMKGEDAQPPVAEQPTGETPVAEPAKPQEPVAAKPAEPTEPVKGAQDQTDKPVDVPPAEPAKPTEVAVVAGEPKPGEPKPGEPAQPTAAAKPGLEPSAGTDPTAAVDAKPSAPPSKAMQACYAKGNRLLNAKKVNLAIRELNKCLDIDPQYGRTYRSLGVAYMLLGRERSAILAYEKFVDYEPDHKDAAKVREIIADYNKRRKN